MQEAVRTSGSLLSDKLVFSADKATVMSLSSKPNCCLPHQVSCARLQIITAGVTGCRLMPCRLVGCRLMSCRLMPCRRLAGCRHSFRAGAGGRVIEPLPEKPASAHISVLMAHGPQDVREGFGNSVYTDTEESSTLEAALPWQDFKSPTLPLVTPPHALYISSVNALVPQGEVWVCHWNFRRKG